MRVFVAGASGAIGTRLVPQLVDRGHEVIGTFKSPGNAERVRALGAESTALDLLDARAVRKAVLEAEPEAIIHQATALADLTGGPAQARSRRASGSIAVSTFHVSNQQDPTMASPSPSPSTSDLVDGALRRAAVPVPVTGEAT
jgi:uncharacterized protein YbjT (DUF2867 family)